MAAPSIDRLTSEALDNYGNKMAYDNFLRYDGIISGLGGAGGIALARANEIEMVTGGQPNFRERTLYSGNTSVAHRGKGTEITVIDDEGYTIISVPMKIVDGAITYNQIERDQVAGQPMLCEGLIEDKILQFNDTFVQAVSDALRQATPGALDPLTLLPSGTTGTVNGILIPRTIAQQATDGATTAGIDRSNSWWRNQYSNTSYDLTTVAGQRGLHLDVYSPTVRGYGAPFEPDVGICAQVIFSSLGATATNNRRGTYQDASGKQVHFGYDNIMFYNARLVRDSSTRFLNGAAGKVAFVNTRALKIKVLKGQGNSMKGMVDENNRLGSLPIFWKEGGMSKFENDIKTLAWVKLGYLTYNLVPKSLQDHGLSDNCT